MNRSTNGNRMSRKLINAYEWKLRAHYILFAMEAAVG